MHTINPNFYRNEEEICWGMGCIPQLVRPVLFRALDDLRSVSALACPIVGFVARLQIPLPHTLAVGPRVRGPHVGVALDLCVSGLCPSDLSG